MDVYEGVRGEHKGVRVEAARWYRHGDHPGVLRVAATATGDASARCPECGRTWDAHGKTRGVDDLVCPGDWVVSLPDGTAESHTSGVFARFFRKATS